MVARPELGADQEDLFVDDTLLDFLQEVVQQQVADRNGAVFLVHGKLIEVADGNSVKILSNYDIERITLEIIGNYEVEFYTGCKLTINKNLLFISDIKKYSPVRITLKKFSRLNKRVD